ncbi:signal peptidase [Enterococcus sp. JM4C]|uniref:signal peptide peptidase SppA n=1 Tax=Candidatus Enterococcus huntleyi TaxID=1857217 RepID=UPI00137B7826|nr:signal peptide peptidase SppA [Enterococcus sp. JM4C]KAF1298619.1 signal peptidase [Enterococcus sp. JM4C]
MNAKRWVAVVVAIALFLFSGLTAGLTRKEATENQRTSLNGLLYGSNELSETVLEQGSSDDKIARIQIEGTISSGTSGSLFSGESYDHESVLKQIALIKENTDVKALLLEVNSPGGGVYESAELARALQDLQQEKKIPIYVSMKNMAASGGYYISAHADKIFATNETVTGSIGVIMSNLNYSGLLEKLGIDDATVKSGALKDMGSATRPETKEEVQVLQAYIDSAYNRFVTIVSEGRGMSVPEVKEVADGRIYDGKQALDAGLVDAIGFPDEALAALRKEHGLEKAQFVQYSLDSTGFANTWLGSKLAQLQGLQPSESSQINSLLKSIGTSEAPKAMYYYGGE